MSNSGCDPICCGGCCEMCRYNGNLVPRFVSDGVEVRVVLVRRDEDD